MKRITEDYCSFEIAKLLKEKGFDIPCKQAYFNGSLVDYTMYGFCDGELLDCPSQSLALKWLRELGIVITIKTHYPSNPELCKIPYSFLIEDYRPSRNMEKEHGKYSTGYSSCANMDDFLIENKLLFNGFNFGEFEKYEEAVEAALKYTLENLI